MAEPIRILHVIDKLSMDGVNPSSCSRLFVEWIPRHAPEQFQVQVASLRPPDTAGEFLQRRGIRVHYITKGKFSPKNIAAIAALARDGKFDLLHLHGYSSANFGRLAARKLGIPAIVHEHAILRVLPHQFVIDRLLRGKTDVAIGVSNAVKAFMIRGRSIPEAKIRVIWNGVQLQNFRNVAKEKIDAFRQNLGVDAKARLIGSVTRLREEKGNRFLIEAFARLREKYPETRLVLIGDGPLKSALEQQAKEQGDGDRVIFTGFVPEIAPALAAFDVVAVPSLREGFGLVLVEAMACGKPVVASAVGGMLEVAEDGVSALLVPPADAAALAGAIDSCLADAEFAAALGRRAQEASEKFSIEANVSALEKLYAELVPGKGKKEQEPEPMAV